MVTIGTKIKLLRALFNMNQSELARQVNISQSQLSLIEMDLAPTLDSSVVDRIRSVFGGVDFNDPRIEQFASIKLQPLAV